MDDSKRAKLGLNIGAGNSPYGDTDEIKWINIEPFYTQDHPLTDSSLVGRYHMLPIKAQNIDKHFAGDSFDVIHIVHALEHVPTEDADEIVKKCYNLLRPRAYIEIETPDLDKACKLWLEGDQSDRVLGLFYGGRTDEPGQLHQTGFNFNRYKNLLGNIGFKDIKKIKLGEGHGIAEPKYDIRIRAYK
jgi:predicted SAM-dependent methyltransferase